MVFLMFVLKNCFSPYLVFSLINQKKENKAEKIHV